MSNQHLKGGSSKAPAAAAQANVSFSQIPDEYFDHAVPVLLRAKLRKAALILGVIIRESFARADAPTWIALPFTEFGERCGCSRAAMAAALRILTVVGLLEARQQARAFLGIEYRVVIDVLKSPTIVAACLAKGVVN